MHCSEEKPVNVEVGGLKIFVRLEICLRGGGRNKLQQKKNEGNFSPNWTVHEKLLQSPPSGFTEEEKNSRKFKLPTLNKWMAHGGLGHRSHFCIQVWEGQTVNTRFFVRGCFFFLFLKIDASSFLLRSTPAVRECHPETKDKYAKTENQRHLRAKPRP